MALCEPMEGASALTFLTLDGDTIAFSERAQRLVSLNPAAAFIATRLQAGSPQSRIVNELVAEGLASAETAEAWLSSVRESISSLFDNAACGQPLLTDPENADTENRGGKISPYQAFTAKGEQRYRLLGTCVLIRYALKDQMHLVNSVIGHLATDEPGIPTDVIDVWGERIEGVHIRSRVWRNGEPMGEVRRLALLGPFVKSLIWQSAVNRYDFLFYFHAGVVGTGVSCILFPAPPGSGKSSLTAAMISKGYDYYSDEVALVQRQTFRVPAMPLALCVKESGWNVMERYFSGIANLPRHRRSDGKLVRYVPPPENATKHPPAQVSHIIFPRYNKDCTTELRPLPRAEALGRLMGECLALTQRLDQENVASIVNWMAGIRCYSLEFSALDEATELIAEIAPVAA